MTDTNDERPREHVCAFPKEGHKPLSDDASVHFLLALTCPLCLHDMFTPEVCIECSHKFTLDPSRGIITIEGLK